MCRTLNNIRNDIELYVGCRSDKEYLADQLEALSYEIREKAEILRDQSAGVDVDRATLDLKRMAA